MCAKPANTYRSPHSASIGSTRWWGQSPRVSLASAAGQLDTATGVEPYEVHRKREEKSDSDRFLTVRTSLLGDRNRVSRFSPVSRFHGWALQRDFRRNSRSGTKGRSEMRKRTMAAVALLAIVGGPIVVWAQDKPGASSDPFTRLFAKLDELTRQVNETSADLKGTTRSWDRKLPANDPGGPCPSNSSRFTCVLGGEAVRDNETGLVWQQAPSSDKRTWGLGGVNARWACVEARTGGVTGWRLPSVHELLSLADPTQNEPALPLGHPFSNVRAGWGEGYWSASATNEGSGAAWTVGFYWATAGPTYIGVSTY